MIRQAAPRWLGVLLAAAAGVLAWRVAALAILHGQGVAREQSLVLATLLALVGIVFVACGLLVYRRRPGPARTPRRTIQGGRRLPLGPMLFLVPQLLLPPGPASATAPQAALDYGLVLPSDICRGLVIVPVALGDGPMTTVELILDTGSSWTFLDPRALAGLWGGSAPSGKVTFDDARIGGFELPPLRAYLHPMKRLSLALGRRIDGILGFPAFRAVLLTLDYPAREVRVSAGRLPPPDGREVFRDVGSRRPHLRIEVGGRRVKAVLDSGASGGFLLKPRDRLAWSVAPRPAITTALFAGFAVDEAGRLDGGLRLGPLRFEDPVVQLVPRERTIGWRVLRHFAVTFDQRTKRVRLRPATPGPIRMAPLVGPGYGVSPHPEGLEIVTVFLGTSAAAAGLRTGDLVVAIDGTAVDERGCGDPESLQIGRPQILSYLREGAPVEVEISTEILVP